MLPRARPSPARSPTPPRIPRGCTLALAALLGATAARAGVAAAPAPHRVRARVAYDFRAATARVTLSTANGAGEIRYTLAGEPPRADSAPYRGPLRLRLPVTVRAAVFAGSRRIGPILARRIDLATAQRRTRRELSPCGARGCWVYRQADFDVARRVRVAIRRAPAAPARRARARPSPAPGDLLLRLDGCAGAPFARLPLPRTGDPLVVLPTVRVPAAVHGLHDLCVRLAPAARGETWVLAWIDLQAPASAPSPTH